MKVLLVNKFYYLRGGSERNFFETKKVLEARGHRVIPFSMQDERNEPTPFARYFVNHVEFNQNHSLREKLEIVPRVIYFSQARRKLERLLQKEHVDVAHLHNVAHQISPSILDSLRKYEIPVVHTLHDYKLICPTYTMFTKGQVCERCRGGRYYQVAFNKCNKDSLSASLLNMVEMYTHRLLGFYRRGVDLFIAPSQFLRRKLIEHGIGNVPIFFLSAFVDTKEYKPRYGGEDYCVYFGRLSLEKGVTTLIRSMRGLEGFRLLIVGEGPEQRSLQNLAQKERLNNVEFVGYLQGENLKEVVRGSLFVVVPSQWYENCPASILESFALGKPVIGSNMGGIPELITPGRDGLVFQAGDADDLKEKIRELAADREGAIKMGMNARAKVENKYGVDIYYKRLMFAYNQVLN